MKSAKYATLFLGVFAVLLALNIPGLLDLILYSACFYAPIVIVPMLLAIFGFQTSRRVILLAMSTGFITVMYYLLVFQSTASFFPGLLANLVTIFSVHYLLQEEGGWGHNPLRNKEEEQFSQLLQPPWKSQLDPQKKKSS